MNDATRYKKAAALEFDGSGAPRVTAKGSGLIAEQIIARAEAAGVPVREDPALTKLLTTLDLGTEIPPELYCAVAEIIAWVYKLDRKSAESRRDEAHTARDRRQR